MPLPLPTVPNIDVDVERLKEVERDYAMAPKTTGIETGILAGVQTGEEANELISKMSKRDRANTMQKILDAGWPAYEEAWKAAGAKPELSPDLLKGVPDGLVLGWKGVSEESERAKATAAIGDYEAIIADPNASDEVRNAARIKAGKTISPTKGLEVIEDVEKGRATNEAAKTKADSMEKIATLKADTQKTIQGMKKALASTKDASAIAAIENEYESYQALATELDEAYTAVSGMTPGEARRDKVYGPKIARIEREMNDINSRASALILKVSDVSKVPPRPKVGGAPAPAPATNAPPAAHPDAKKGNDGGWYIPDPKRPGKYLKVG